jgi:hypothetical protein
LPVGARRTVTDMSINAAPRVALLWHGDPGTRKSATLAQHRFSGVAEALRQMAVGAEPAVYADEYVDEVRDQLLTVDGVLVWVNPIENGRDRFILDAMLRQVADEGIFVSAHPSVIQKMGTKEVLFRTRGMSWGCDTHLYATPQELREQLPLRLAEGKPRVLKQCRGNGGNGVWKVALRSGSPGAMVGSYAEQAPQSGASVRVRHALRGSIEEVVPLGEFLDRCEPYFTGSGRIIDQPYQERLTDGMVRCYLAGDKVVGFGHQAINALFPPRPGVPPGDAPQPGPRLYHPPARPEFQPIKMQMEEEWLPAMRQVLEIDTESLPVIWDADFLYGPKTALGEDTYVLCEINVSSVYPFPDSALEPLARETSRRVRAAMRLRTA